MCYDMLMLKTVYRMYVNVGHLASIVKMLMPVYRVSQKYETTYNERVLTNTSKYGFIECQRIAKLRPACHHGY